MSFLKNIFGEAVSLQELKVGLGIPDHCNILCVTGGTESGGVYFGAACQETSLTITLFLGLHFSAKYEGLCRFCRVDAVFRDRNLNDPREVGVSKKLTQNLVSFLGEFGFDRILGICHRSDEHNGYYVWAKLGFNGLVQTRIRSVLRSELGGYTRDTRTVQGLLSLPNGAELWSELGHTYKGRIKLRKI